MLDAIKVSKSTKRVAIALTVASSLGFATLAAPAKAATPVTISVVLAAPPLPAPMLAEFTKATGITVKWTQLDWDSLQTKIAAAATANTYFADATDVDWSRVGQLGKLNWFLPMENMLILRLLLQTCLKSVALLKMDTLSVFRMTLHLW